MFIRSTPATAPQNDTVARRDAKGVLSPPAAISSNRQPSPPTEPVTPPASAAVSSNTQDQSVEKESGARLIVGPDVKLKGAEILDCDMLVVEGRVEATMDSRVIRIADKGAFSGKVSIDVAEIHGSFDGELTARSQLVIHATGRVSGKIRYGKLVIAEGGELCGDINALSAERSSPPILNAVSA